MAEQPAELLAGVPLARTDVAVALHALQHALGAPRQPYAAVAVHYLIGLAGDAVVLLALGRRSLEVAAGDLQVPAAAPTPGGRGTGRRRARRTRIWWQAARGQRHEQPPLVEPQSWQSMQVPALTMLGLPHWSQMSPVRLRGGAWAS